jgi:hypothetical protein
VSWIDKLKAKWNITSGFQFLIILIVFACTGTTVVFIKKPIVAFFSDGGEQSIWFTVAYVLLILPIYNALLLMYGFLFGQFSFFWSYEKRTLGRFVRKKKDDLPKDSGNSAD